MFAARLTVVIIAILGVIIARDPNSSVFGIVSFAWAGFGASFGPLMICSLFWKRTNLAGAVSGILSGGLFVIIWDYVPVVNGSTLSDATGIYSLLLGFFFSLACIVIVSLCTKKPEQSIIKCI